MLPSIIIKYLLPQSMWPHPYILSMYQTYNRLYGSTQTSCWNHFPSALIKMWNSINFSIQHNQSLSSRVWVYAMIPQLYTTIMPINLGITSIAESPPIKSFTYRLITFLKFWIIDLLSLIKVPRKGVKLSFRFINNCIHHLIQISQHFHHIIIKFIQHSHHIIIKII